MSGLRLSDDFRSHNARSLMLFFSLSVLFSLDLIEDEIKNAAKLLDKMVKMDTIMTLKGFVGLTVDLRSREKYDDDLQKPGDMISYQGDSGRRLMRHQTKVLEKMGMTICYSIYPAYHRLVLPDWCYSPRCAGNMG